MYTTKRMISPGTEENMGVKFPMLDMLNDPRMFDVIMIMMAHMNRRVIEYLKNGQALVA